MVKVEGVDGPVWLNPATVDAIDMLPGPGDDYVRIIWHSGSSCCHTYVEGPSLDEVKEMIFGKGEEEDTPRTTGPCIYDHSKPSPCNCNPYYPLNMYGESL